MHVALDVRPALRRGTGVGTYVLNLTTALADGFPEDRYTVFSASWKDRLDTGVLPANVTVADRRVPVRVMNWAWHRWRRPPIERFVGPVDIAHSPSPLLLPARRARTVVSLHDCYFMRHPEDVSGTVLHDYVPLARAAAQRADAVIAISEASADDIEEVMGISRDKITVTPLGVDPRLFHPNDDAADAAPVRTGRRARIPDGADEAAAAPLLRQFGIERPFLLFVGRRERRKDLGTLLAAFAALRDHGCDVDLVLVGPEAPGWTATWDAAPAAARQHTKLIPYQSSTRLAAWNRAAAIAVLPSRWEGFGLTGLEAMACGTPVVASAAGALPEVLGDAALFADPGDAAAFADRCVGLLEDPRRAAALIDKGLARAARYTWHHTAARTHAMYRELAS